LGISITLIRHLLQFKRFLSQVRAHSGPNSENRRNSGFATVGEECGLPEAEYQVLSDLEYEILLKTFLILNGEFDGE
jgi:hypothetical protein